MTVYEMPDDGGQHADTPPCKRASTPSASGCLARLKDAPKKTTPGAVWAVGQRLGAILSRGVNRPPNRHCGSPTRSPSFPVGRTVRSVGRTGATRGYPVGRTG